jgi:predicted alpha/beta hydrolase family esterase
MNCLIIHGCPIHAEKAMNPETRTYDKHWLPWTKKQLNGRSIKTEITLMPNPWSPVYEDYKKEFAKYLIDEDTILIGTSCGCSFLVRWLGETKKKINKLILVAPWKIADASKIEKSFYEFPIDTTIKERVKKIIMFTSNNEAVNGKKSLEIFHEALGGQIINLPDHGHYILQHMGTEEFPELVEAVLK